MTEDAVAPEAGAPEQTGGGEPAAEEQSFNFHEFIEPDGTFKDGWKDGLPEEIQHELSLGTFTNIGEGMKQLVNAQKMIGKNKVVIPTEKDGPDAWDAFHRTLGRPESADEYEMSLPEEGREYYDETAIGQAKELFHKLGLNQKQVQAIWEFEKARTNQQILESEQTEQAAFEEAERLIREERGEALEESQHLANKLIADFFPEDDRREAFLEIVNEHALRPFLFGLLADIQQKYREEHGGPPGESATGVMTPAQLEAKADELMQTPGYIDGTMKQNNPAGYKRLTDEITALYNRIDRQKSR